MKALSVKFIQNNNRWMSVSEIESIDRLLLLPFNVQSVVSASSRLHTGQG